VSYSVALRVGEPLVNAQAAASVTLFIVASSVLLMSARPLNAIRIAIVASMVAAFLAVLFIPFLSNFFALSLGPERYSIVAIVSGLVGAVLVWVVGLFVDRWRRPQAAR
jgi:cation-transporting ATPase E